MLYKNKEVIGYR